MPDRKKQIESLERATLFATTPTFPAKPQKDCDEMIWLNISGTILIEFQGASRDELGQYSERGAIWINPAQVSAIYDHTILLDGHKIRVMETEPDIIKKLTWRNKDDVQSDR